MLLKFLQAHSLAVVESFDDSDDSDEKIESEEMNFSKDEIIDVDIFGNENGLLDIQFGDGSASFGVPIKLFDMPGSYVKSEDADLYPNENERLSIQFDRWREDKPEQPLLYGNVK
jgi:hypothetical protein